MSTNRPLTKKARIGKTKKSPASAVSFNQTKTLAEDHTKGETRLNIQIQIILGLGDSLDIPKLSGVYHLSIDYNLCPLWAVSALCVNNSTGNEAQVSFDSLHHNSP